MPKRERFTKEDFEDWGDPRGWSEYHPQTNRSGAHSGANALSNPDLWPLINRFLGKKRRGQRGSNS